jgi:hypothetical protein
LQRLLQTRSVFHEDGSIKTFGLVLAVDQSGVDGGRVLPPRNVAAWAALLKMLCNTSFRQRFQQVPLRCSRDEGARRMSRLDVRGELAQVKAIRQGMGDVLKSRNKDYEASGW